MTTEYYATPSVQEIHKPTVERVHQTIGNIICTFNIQETDLDNENPWERILSSTMFAILSMVHTATQHK